MRPRAPSVLIIGFRAFSGRAVNASATLVSYLERQHVPGVNVLGAVLPVVWGAVEARLPAWLALFRPALVLGLGEGRPGGLVLEARAHNRAEGVDELGLAPTTGRLTPVGPDSLASRFEMGAEPRAGSRLWHRSQDAGAFLCNNLLYRMLETAPGPAGFVHVAPQQGLSDKAYCRDYGPPLLSLLRNNL